MLHATRTTFLTVLALTAAGGAAQAQDLSPINGWARIELVQSDPAQTETDADVHAALFTALGLPEMIDIMRAEGLDYGADIASDLLSGRADAAWADQVSAIYDTDMMRDGVARVLAASLDDADVAPMLDFFTSDVGKEVIALEISARRALLDDAVETAAKDAAAVAFADATPRSVMVDRFIAANALIDTNVVGAMNANYAFYMGLMDGGAFPNDLTEEQILTDVYTQEPEIRQSTTDWVQAFLMLAYQPLSDADLQAYTDFSTTPAGQALNTAMFAAFDQMFVAISRELGRASAVSLAGQDI